MDDIEQLPSDEWGIDRLHNFVGLLKMSDRLLHHVGKAAGKLEASAGADGYLSPTSQSGALLSELASAHAMANRCVIWGLRSLMR